MSGRYLPCRSSDSRLNVCVVNIGAADRGDMIDVVPSEVVRRGDKWQGQSQQSWRPCCLLCLRKLSEQRTYRGVTRRFRIYHHLCNKRERIGSRKHGDRWRQLGAQKNNQDSPDGKLENADWVVKRMERKGFRQKPTGYPNRLDNYRQKQGRSSSRGNNRHQLSHQDWRGKTYKPSHYVRRQPRCSW